MAQTFKTASLGTISHGTMRECDLIPAFLSELERLGHSKKQVKKWELEYDSYCDESDEYGDIRDDRIERAGELLGELFNALEEHSPPYCYFGSNEGDGADYGFWFSHDSFDDACANGEIVKLCFPYIPDHTGLDQWDGAEYAAFVNDHGNITLYNRDGEIVLEIV